MINETQLKLKEKNLDSHQLDAAFVVQKKKDTCHLEQRGAKKKKLKK